MSSMEELAKLLADAFNAIYYERDADKAVSFFTPVLYWHSERGDITYTHSMLRALVRKKAVLLHAQPKFSVAAVRSGPISDKVEILYARIGVQRLKNSDMTVDERWEAAVTFITENEGDTPKIASLNFLVDTEGEKYRLHREANETAELMQIISHNIDCGLVVFDVKEDGTECASYINDSMSYMTGYSREEIFDVVKRQGSAAAGMLRETVTDEQREQLDNGAPLTVEYQMPTKFGGAVWVLARGRRLEGVGNVRYIWTFTNIDEQKRSTIDLEMERRRYNSVLEMTDTVVFEYDPVNDIMDHADGWSGRFPFPQKILGFVEFMESFEYVHEEDKPKLISLLTDCCRVNTCEIRIMDNSGSFIWYRLQCCPIMDSEGCVAVLIGTYKCIDEEKKKYQELYEKSRHESVSGLLNLSAAAEDITAFLKSPEAADGVHGLMIIDLDNFSYISEYLGYMFSNLVIGNIAAKLRELCSADCTLARIGADEFMIFMPNSKEWDIMATANTLSHVLDNVYTGNLSDVTVRCRVGLSLSTDEGGADLKYSEMFDRADRALSSAKAETGNCFARY